MSELPPPPQLLLDPRRAAQALSISPRTLWTWTQRGDLRCVRCGRLVRYRVADLERFAVEHLADALPAGVQP
jgi:excisionase family DNA binding protein